jgi:hypothetical protein
MYGAPQYPPQMPHDPYWAHRQQHDDDSHLKILSICFWIKGGLQIFGGIFALIYVVIGAAILADAGSKDPGAAVAGTVFAVIGVLVMILASTIAVLEFVTASSLAKRKRWTLCFVIACLSCLSVPLGTILGIFTIMVLQRPSVKAAFQQNAV